MSEVGERVQYRVRAMSGALIGWAKTGGRVRELWRCEGCPLELRVDAWRMRGGHPAARIAGPWRVTVRGEQ